MILKKVVFVSMALGISVATLAHDGAMGVVKERMDAMSDMGKKSKAASKMFKGESDFKLSVVAQAAESFVMHSDSMVRLFPDSQASRTGKTQALQSVWEDRDDFVAEVEQFSANSKLLKDAVAASAVQQVLRDAFLKTAKNCRSCHKQFRKARR